MDEKNQENSSLPYYPCRPRQICQSTTAPKEMQPHFSASRQAPQLFSLELTAKLRYPQIVMQTTHPRLLPVASPPPASGVGLEAMDSAPYAFHFRCSWSSATKPPGLAFSHVLPQSTLWEAFLCIWTTTPAKIEHLGRNTF